MQNVIDILTGPAATAVLIALGVAVIDALAAAVAGTHPLIARALVALANLLRANTTGGPPTRLPPILLALALLPLAAVSARAETITTTSGRQYARAADGQFYPASHVRPDGSVIATPISTAATTCRCAGGCGCVGTRYYVCPTSHGRPCEAAPHPPTAFPAYQPPGHPGGACGRPGETIIWQSGPGTLGTKPQTFGPIAVPQQSCPSCPGGACPAPAHRPLLFRR